MKKILIYDDEEKQTKRFENILKQVLKKVGQDQDFAIETLCDNDLQFSIEALQNRQDGFRNDKKCSNVDTKFDEASIFIIDYDLLNSQEAKFLTGEIIAYIVRCFSECKLIVGLNQYGRNSFNLTLRGHPESFADLNLGVDQLGNPDLWRGDWGDLREDYRPWYWPNLSDSWVILIEKLRMFERIWTNPFAKFSILTASCFSCCPAKLCNSLEKVKVKNRLKRHSGSLFLNLAMA